MKALYTITLYTNHWELLHEEQVRGQQEAIAYGKIYPLANNFRIYAKNRRGHYFHKFRDSWGEITRERFMQQVRKHTPNK